MLDQETKNNIDSARQILVGKVPDPKSQIEQITIALIYKFMDDMDRENQEAGFKKQYFVRDWQKYAWTKLLDQRLSGDERLDLYIQAISNMPKNSHIPQLFRDIFKDAFLPYKDGRTLSLFLKEINKFTYDNSENLGSAFEYLLSIMGSQGDAGQFRTPRHIIDFIVEVVDPKKNERILDPACGTAGFLISAYKYIVKQSKEKRLTLDEKNRLMSNMIGYDISPDMVRLALVNLYLHGFSEPKIHEYDTLTSEKRWEEYFDVILANPPFMSPKGGIQPHDRFSVSATRSEVLFVDYIAEHLTLKGRAGIIVPEGIIFQSGNAYKELRKLLVDENYLYAVVSLPGGVFQPYSGVKTSILFLDRQLAKRKNEILFVRIDNDGFDLGAQRRQITKNDLPEAIKIINDWKDDKNISKNPRVIIAEKNKIAENGDYNLSAERYKIIEKRKKQKWEMVKLEELCILIRGVVYSKKDEVSTGGYKILRANNVDLFCQVNLDDIKEISKDLNISNDKKLYKNDILICLASGSKQHIGKVAFIDQDTDYYFGGFMGVIRTNEKINSKFLFYNLKADLFNSYLRHTITGANINNLNSSILYNFKIPLPPLEVQEQIVAEIETYQKIIDGARQIIENWKPKINVDEKWEMVRLGDVCEVKGGKRLPKGSDFSKHKTKHPYIRVSDFADGCIDLIKLKYINDVIFSQISNYIITKNDVYISIAGTIGLTGTIPTELDGSNLTENAAKLVIQTKNLSNRYLARILQTTNCQKQIEQLTHAVGVPKLALERIRCIEIPLPSLVDQEKIVSAIEEEEKIIIANKRLIELMENKIAAVIASIYQE
ncbi:MAG: N-6 DNA methylase [Planctomycetaceae bacterium]|jgi:type I restriction enzyme M protein|nr:N-6 DNA methylase [Planctomycetaceae bacterium]